MEEAHAKLSVAEELILPLDQETSLLLLRGADRSRCGADL